MIVTIGNYEWNIPAGSVIKNGRKVVGEVRVKSDAYWAIDEGYRIVSCSGRVITRQSKMKCGRCAGGVLNKEGKNRYCNKCRAEYQFNGKGWDLISLAKEIEHAVVYHEKRHKFLDDINTAENKFKMVGTGASEIDKYRIRDKNYKEIELTGQRKMYCLDGKIRYVSWEHVGTKVKILGYGDGEEVGFEIGDPMCSIEDGRGLFAGYKVLRLKEFSGCLPSESEYYIIEGELVPVVVNAKIKTRQQNISVKRKSHAKKHKVLVTPETNKVDKNMDRDARIECDEITSLNERIKKL